LLVRGADHSIQRRDLVCLARGIVNHARASLAYLSAAIYGMPFALHYTTLQSHRHRPDPWSGLELGRDNIPVNAVTPTAVMTEATAEFFGDRIDRRLEVIHAGQSIQRTLAPADLAGTIAWLIGDGSQFVTGQTIAVDGGTVML